MFSCLSKKPQNTSKYEERIQFLEHELEQSKREIQRLNNLIGKPLLHDSNPSWAQADFVYSAPTKVAAQTQTGLQLALSESSTRDKDNCTLSDLLRGEMNFFFKILDEECKESFLQETFSNNKGKEDEGITGCNIKKALKEIHVQFDPRITDDEVMRIFDADGNGIVDYAEFKAGIPVMSQLVHWLSSSPWTGLIACALNALVLSDTGSESSESVVNPLASIQKCSDRDISIVCQGLASGLSKLLLHNVAQLRSEPQAQCDSWLNSSKQKLSENLFDSEQDDDEVFEKLFHEIHLSPPDKTHEHVSSEEIEKALKVFKADDQMTQFLASLSKRELPVNLKNFKENAKQTLRLSGQRIVWARTLGLDAAFAQFLSPGTLFDGLHGIQQMDIVDLRRSCEKFSSIMPKLIEKEWRKLKQLKSPDSQSASGIEGVMNKFISDGGFLGKFGNEEMFHQGLEVQIGYPNPKLFKAILREHCLGESANELFMTGNYGLITSPLREFARLFGERKGGFFEDKIENLKLNSLGFLKKQGGKNGPTLEELKEVVEEFKLMQKECVTVLTREGSMFSGEDGDYHCETLFQIDFTTSKQLMSGERDEIIAKICKNLKEQLDEDLKCDKRKGRTNLNIRAAEALKRGICLISSENTGNNVSLTISVPHPNHEYPVDLEAAAEQNIRNNTTKACEKFSVVQGSILVRMLKQNTYYFVENLDKMLDDKGVFSAQKCRDVLKDVNQNDLIKRWQAWSITGGKPSVDKDEYINGIVSKLEAGKLKHARRNLTIMQLMKIVDEREANVGGDKEPCVDEKSLRVEEVIAIYQYTGPLFQVWNALLRNMDPTHTSANSRYTTTIHVLVSAVIKLAQTTKLPSGRRVFRGLGGMVLDQNWFKSNARGVRGGVELGFLSTTFNRATALEYSGVKKGRGIVLAIDIGAIDCGAQLDFLSQYPGEGELLFGPLSYLEVVGLPRYEIFNRQQVVVVSVKINVNLKAQKIEDMIAKRQQIHLGSFDFLIDDVTYDLYKIAEKDSAFRDRIKEDKSSKHYSLDSFIAEIMEQLKRRKQAHMKFKPTEFLDNDNFRGLMIDMLDTAAYARSKMQLYLEDKTLAISDVFNFSLSAAHRIKIAQASKKMSEDKKKRDAGDDYSDIQRDAENLCRLKGLFHAAGIKQQNALMDATANGLCKEDLKLLIDSGILVNADDEDGTTALSVAAQCANGRCIQDLIGLNAEVNVYDLYRRTPLHSAAMIGDLGCIKLLCEHNADVNAADVNGIQAVAIAAAAGHIECLQYLLQLAGTNSQAASQMKPQMLSALSIAIKNRQIERVEYIIKTIADHKMICQDDFEQTAIYLLKSVIDFKLEAGNILRFFGMEVKTPKNLASERFEDALKASVIEIGPLLGRALFRFCDVNGDQQVTEEEVIERIKIIFEVGASNEITSGFGTFLKAVFNTMDLDRDGNISLEEAKEIIVRMITVVFQLFEQILGHLRKDVLENDDVFGEVADMLSTMLGNDSAQSSYEISTIVRFFSKFYSESDVAELHVGFKGILSYLLPQNTYERYLKAMIDQFQAFFKEIVDPKYDLDGSVTASSCADVGTRCVAEVIKMIKQDSDELSAFSVEKIMEQLNATLDEAPEDHQFRWIIIDQSFVVDILCSVFKNVYNCLIETAIQQMMIIFFNFLGMIQAVSGLTKQPPSPPTEKVVLKKHDLLTLRDSMVKVLEGQNQCSVKERLCSLQMVAMSFGETSDIGDKKVVGDVIKSFALLLHGWLEIFLQVANHTLQNVAEPLLRPILDIKSQILGGSKTELTSSDLSSVALLVGASKGEVQAIGILMDFLESDDGYITREATIKMCDALLHLVLGQPQVRSYTCDAMRSLGEKYARKEWCNKAHNIVIEKARAFCPLIGKTLFLLFDLDRNDKVDKQEVREVLKILEALMMEDKSLTYIATNVAHASFRVFDINGNGAIEETEITQILSEWITAMQTFVKDVLTVFMQTVFLEQAEPIVDIIWDLTQPDDQIEPISIQRLVSMISDLYSEIYFHTLQQMVLEVININSMRQEIRIIVESARHHVSELWEALKKSSDLSDCVKSCLECAERVFKDVEHTADFLESKFIPVVTDLLSSVKSDEAPWKWLAIDEKLVRECCCNIVKACGTKLRNGVMENYFVSFFQFFNDQNTGKVNIEYLLAVKDLVYALFENYDDPELLKSKLAALQEVLFKIGATMDLDRDGCLNRQEMVTCVRRLAKLVFTWMGITVELLGDVVTGAIKPAVKLALNVKAQLLGGQSDQVTHTDICSAILAVGISENDESVLKEVKELLTRDHDILQVEVFENLAVNLVRLLLFWNEECRQASGDTLRWVGALMAWEPKESDLDRFHTNLMTKAVIVCPLLGKALHNLFDLDKDGKVSKKEIEQILDFVSSSDSENDFKELALAVYRIFPSDDEGNIGTDNFAKAIAEIVEILSKLASELIDSCQSLTQEPLVEFINLFCDYIKESIQSLPSTLSNFISALTSAFNQEFLDDMLKDVKNYLQPLLAYFALLDGDLKESLQRLQYESLFRESRSEGSQPFKNDAILRLLQAIIEDINKTFNENLQDMVKYFCSKMEVIEDIAVDEKNIVIKIQYSRMSKKISKTLNVEKRLVLEIISSAVQTFRDKVVQSGAKQFLNALADVLHLRIADDSGAAIMKCIQQLHDQLALQNEIDTAELKSKSMALLTEWIRPVCPVEDSEGEVSIGPQQIQRCAKTVSNFVFALAAVLVDFVKPIITPGATSVFKLALTIKGLLLGADASDNVLAKTDVERIVALLTSK